MNLEDHLLTRMLSKALNYMEFARSLSAGRIPDALEFFLAENERIGESRVTKEKIKRCQARVSHLSAANRPNDKTVLFYTPYIIEASSNFVGRGVINTCT